MSKDSKESGGGTKEGKVVKEGGKDNKPPKDPKSEKGKVKD